MMQTTMTVQDRIRRHGVGIRIGFAVAMTLLGLGVFPGTRSAGALCTTNECWADESLTQWQHITLSIEDTWDFVLSGTVTCTAVVTQAACASPGDSVAVSANFTMCPVPIGGTLTGTFTASDGISPGTINLTNGLFSLQFPVGGYNTAAPNSIRCVASDQPAGGIGLTTMTGTFSANGSSGSVTATRRCRNGTLDAGETCDAGACCTTSTCQIAAAGTLCREAAGECQAEDTCDGASASSCPDLDVPDGTPCSDGVACTTGEACANGACQGGSAVVCPLCQRCDSSSGACVDGPRSCDVSGFPGKSTLQLKDGTDDSVAFKWGGGLSPTTTDDFGDPVNTDDYALCLFDASQHLFFRAEVPAGGFCGSKPCWTTLGSTGFRYKSTLRESDGADKISLKAGGPGHAKVRFKGKGPHLPPFSLPLSSTTQAQLQSASGPCWSAYFYLLNASKNDATQFKGKN